MCIRDSFEFTTSIRKHVHSAMASGDGTRDLCGPSGLTTEKFIENIATRIRTGDPPPPPAKVREPDRKLRRNYNVDEAAVKAMFDEFDSDRNGLIDLAEFTKMIVKLGVAPRAVA